MNKGNFTWLMVALLFFLIGVPIAEDAGLLSSRITRSVAFSVLMAIGITSLRGSPVKYKIGLITAAIGIILNVAAVNFSQPRLFFVSYLAFFVFLFLAAINAFGRVVFTDEISSDRMIGAVCIYMLLGVIWAVAYAMMYMALPDSFSFSHGGQMMISEWLYFSFVTMTTLGYGDILPVSATARALAYLQSIVGQFYIAILVAGLVSVYISKRSGS